MNDVTVWARALLQEATMSDRDFADNRTVTLDTRPLSEVPTYGVFIWQAGQNVWDVYRKTNLRARTYREYAICETVYSTDIGTRNKGKQIFFHDSDQVAYTGVILKGEI